MFFSAATSVTTVTENGEVIERQVHTITEPTALIASSAYTFLVFNIPTTVLFAIYAACRGKRRKQRALEKMSVQDLE